MRLINTRTFHLEDFSSKKKPRYGILSHRWREREVTFAGMVEGGSRGVVSSPKLCGFLKELRKDSIRFGWADTCCINKESSAELSEAINSMYQWYQNATVCYVYLSDVHSKHWRTSLLRSEWFKRGWTLQELLAPQVVKFYDCSWRLLGTKRDLANEISSATGIPTNAIENGSLDQFSVAQKMSWAARRLTTRLEDSAYSLIGLFAVNMPLLYGEGEKAFFRLQDEIIKHSDDHSIFAWSMGRRRASGLLAPSASCFSNSQDKTSYVSHTDSQPFAMTNRGLSIRLEITPWAADTYLAYLDCAQCTGSKERVRVGLFIRRLAEDDQYARVNFRRKGLWFDNNQQHYTRDRPTQRRRLFVRQFVSSELAEDCLGGCLYGFKLSDSLLRCVTTSSTPPVSLTRPTATLRYGDWGCAMVADLSPSTHGLRKIALGFDFDFHPVCLLQDSALHKNSTDLTDTNTFDWSCESPDQVDWDEIIEGSHVYRRKNHDGIWALRGHRLHGLDVLLSASFTGQGSLVTMRRARDGPRQVWELDIDKLTGPFRNRNHSALISHSGDRANFQASFGLDMTEDELGEGDGILEAMYDLSQAPRNA